MCTKVTGSTDEDAELGLLDDGVHGQRDGDSGVERWGSKGSSMSRSSSDSKSSSPQAVRAALRSDSA